MSRSVGWQWNVVAHVPTETTPSARLSDVRRETPSQSRLSFPPSMLRRTDLLDVCGLTCETPDGCGIDLQWLGLYRLVNGLVLFSRRSESLQPGVCRTRLPRSPRTQCSAAGDIWWILRFGGGQPLTSHLTNRPIVVNRNRRGQQHPRRCGSAASDRRRPASSRGVSLASASLVVEHWRWRLGTSLDLRRYSGPLERLELPGPSLLFAEFNSAVPGR